MAVTNKYRGYGIGKELLKAAIEKIKKLKAGELFLQTNKNLIAANTLYKKTGFEKTSNNPLGAAKYKRKTYAMKYKIKK
jgi:ribosomal protein S18 acetylase RimI-like enzyme